MSGEEFFHWLQEKQPRLASRVVFTTGDVMTQGTDTFLQESGRPFLPKPFTLKQLVAAVKETLAS